MLEEYEWKYWFAKHPLTHRGRWESLSVHWDKACRQMITDNLPAHMTIRGFIFVTKVVVMLCPGLSCDCKALSSLDPTWCHVFLEFNIYCSLSNSKIFVKKYTDKSESLRADRYLRKNRYSGYSTPYLWETAVASGPVVQWTKGCWRDSPWYQRTLPRLWRPERLPPECIAPLC